MLFPVWNYIQALSGFVGAVVQLWGTMCCVNLQAAWPKEGEIPF